MRYTIQMDNHNTRRDEKSMVHYDRDWMLRHRTSTLGSLWRSSNSYPLYKLRLKGNPYVR